MFRLSDKSKEWSGNETSQNGSHADRARDSLSGPAHGEVVVHTTTPITGPFDFFPTPLFVVYTD